MSFERNTLITGISWFSLQYLLVNLKILCFCRRYADMSRSEEPISTEGTKCSNCLAKSLKSRLSYWKRNIYTDIRELLNYGQEDGGILTIESS
jgi:hypothetical protein